MNNIENDSIPIYHEIPDWIKAQLLLEMSDEEIEEEYWRRKYLQSSQANIKENEVKEKINK